MTYDIRCPTNTGITADDGGTPADISRKTKAHRNRVESRRTRRTFGTSVALRSLRSCWTSRSLRSIKSSGSLIPLWSLWANQPGRVTGPLSCRTDHFRAVDGEVPGDIQGSGRAELVDANIPVRPNKQPVLRIRKVVETEPASTAGRLSDCPTFKTRTGTIKLDLESAIGG